MARIKLGPLVTDISGSIGMATIQRNRFGHTLRLKPLPKKSQTSAQYIIRRHMITLQKAWQDLTDDDRRQWDRFIDFSGQTIRKDRSVHLSGHKLFLKYQLFLLLYDQDLLTTITYAPMPDFKTINAIFIDVGEPLMLGFTAIIYSDVYFFVCKLSSPRRENNAFSPAGLRFMKVTYENHIDYDITDSYIAAFGAVPVHGDFIHYSIQYFSATAPVYSGIFTGKIVITSLL